MINSELASIKNSLENEYLIKYPTDAARSMEGESTESILNRLKSIPVESIGPIYFRLNTEIQANLVSKIDDDFFKTLFEGANTHLLARILSRLEKREIVKKLNLLPKHIAMEVRDFLNYKIDTAGFLMETNVMTFSADQTVEEVLLRIRKPTNRFLNVIYVINKEGELVGKVPIQLIATSEPLASLNSIMEKAPAINAMASKEEVVDLIENEKLQQIPVVNINNLLLGVIRNDILISASKQEITEDLQAMFGAGREEQALSKVSFAVRNRLPWLQVNLATAFLASMVVGLFEETIAQITILAIFLPVVAGQSGNTGSQALGVTMRGLALKEIRISQWFRVARKEIMVGLINGVAVAITTGIIVYFWASSFGIALVIGISMVISMVIAGFAGAVIPVALKAIGQDPATSSSIILTTVTDICGFLSFLGLATALSTALGIV